MLCELCDACLLTRGQTATWRCPVCPPQSRCCPGLSELPSAQCPPIMWPRVTTSTLQSDHIAHRDTTTTHPSKCSSLSSQCSSKSSWGIPPSLATMKIIEIWNLPQIRPSNNTFNYQIKIAGVFICWVHPSFLPLSEYLQVWPWPYLQWPPDQTNPWSTCCNSAKNSKNCHFEFRLSCY